MTARLSSLGPLLACIVFSLSLFGWDFSLSEAALFECTDGSGVRVFTDRPAQLLHCIPLSPSHSTPSLPAQQTPTPNFEQQIIQPTIDPSHRGFLSRQNEPPQTNFSLPQPPIGTTFSAEQ